MNSLSQLLQKTESHVSLVGLIPKSLNGIVLCLSLEILVILVSCQYALIVIRS